jgi:hypothetical protein
MQHNNVLIFVNITLYKCVKNCVHILEERSAFWPHCSIKIQLNACHVFAEKTTRGTTYML